jgi:hypothetical protein
MTTYARKAAEAGLTLAILFLLSVALAAGAIAFSEYQNYGYLTAKYPNTSQTQETALKRCCYPDCRVVVNFQNESTSIAVGDEGYGWATAPTKDKGRAWRT